MAGEPIVITVIGGHDLEAALRRLAADAPAQFERVLDESALRVEASAKQRCPVDTGRLRSSIQVSKQPLSRTVGTNVEYGPFVEFGTRRRPAKPFLTPAAEAEREPFSRVIEAAVNQLGGP